MNPKTTGGPYGEKNTETAKTALVSGQMTYIPSESEERGRFAIQRTINGTPYPPTIFRNDVPSRTATFLRILLTARQRAKRHRSHGCSRRKSGHTLSFYSGLSNPAPLHNMERKTESCIPAPAEEPASFPRPSETCSLTGHPLFTREFRSCDCCIGPDGNGYDRTRKPRPSSKRPSMPMRTPYHNGRKNPYEAKSGRNGV